MPTSSPDVLNEKKVIAYYRELASTFIERTLKLDSSAFLSDFVSFLPEGARVFDMGCGSGRDLKWLKAQGFHAEGLERSPELAAFARSYSGCRVWEADFENWDFKDIKADGLLFSGSLVHLPEERVISVMERLGSLLTGHGRIYVSLKEGNGTYRDKNGRIFYLWEKEKAESLWGKVGRNILFFSSQKSGAGTDWLSWVLE
ncbi:class I SAM-dependent methyltransferase [Desulfobotulus mexicanus]|uniref:class I SAM-dependent methyltransferase n=1 Tax=Desulfobotulus mexicanus TaxID=2586642 RepID=UPI0015D134B1|nr:class I SAM-dependent methyltransferase [Desulfobotulus mexicanus]